MNTFIGNGNLVKDPELRETNAGTKVVDFRLAVSTVHKSKTGNKVEEAAFIDCEAWDSAAEFIADKFRKGSGMLVQGRLRTDSWENKEGQKRSRIKLRVAEFRQIPRLPKDDTDDTDDSRGNDVGF